MHNLLAMKKYIFHIHLKVKSLPFIWVLKSLTSHAGKCQWFSLDLCRRKASLSNTWNPVAHSTHHVCSSVESRWAVASVTWIETDWLSLIIVVLINSPGVATSDYKRPEKSYLKLYSQMFNGKTIFKKKQNEPLLARSKKSYTVSLCKVAIQFSYIPKLSTLVEAASL